MLQQCRRLRQLPAMASAAGLSTRVAAASLPKRVTIQEVGPRDGLQNEKQLIPLDVKLRLIDLLSRSGLSRVEAGSFVSPKWVPQMADSESIFKHLQQQQQQQQSSSKQVSYSALTPNLQGLDAALRCGVSEVAVFGAASEAFSQKNINCSVEASLQRFEAVAAKAKEHGVRVRGYVSCVLGCPYSGYVAPAQVLHVTRRLLGMGCYEVSLGDTIGVGTAGSTARLLSALLADKDVPAHRLAVHFHDTYGQALANILVALQHGVTVVDSSVSGLGGCPYATGASGNVATEDVVYMLQGLGVDTGVDLGALLQASAFVDGALGRASGSKVARALHGKQPPSPHDLCK